MVAAGDPVRRLASATTLTGLLDRSELHRRAPASGCRRPGSHELVVADLDRLRRLNEALGHERADLVLAALGSRLAAAFPPERAAGAGSARTSSPCWPPAGVAPPPRPCARRWSSRCGSPASTSIPTLSIGAVEAEGGDDAPEAAELLRRAELAVEAAKSQRPRRRRAAYGRGLESDGLSRLALEGDLSGALQRGEIVPFYQPIVRLSTGALSGFEALVRWRHPRRGLSAPDEFLPLCERDGPDERAGRARCCDAAAGQLADWRKRHRAARRD